MSDTETLRHSASHVLAAAVKKLFPDVKLGIGPAVADGFYYDFAKKDPFTPEDLAKIEKAMLHILKQNVKFEKSDVDFAEAKKMLSGEKYKLELLDDLKSKGEKITFYKSGDFVDLCRGPHVASTGKIGALKLTKMSSAYWKGDEKNDSMQRIYGVAFETREELDAYVKMIEEAEKRDHRKIGKELDLFSFHPSSPGCVFWHPKGFILFNELEKFWREYHRRHGYTEIFTPSVFKKDLWVTSGHWDHYRENMFLFEVEKEQYGLKPMDCPDSIIVYQTRSRSYKELPVRLNEIGRIYRNELSGTLGGMFRVRQITQDDAHIFCTEGQILGEITTIMKMVREFYGMFNLPFKLYLSTRPDNAMGDKKTWDKAEKDLVDAIKINKMEYALKEKDGAFYGPKIDVHVKDALGREWQMATIQLDFQLPGRFGVTYTGEDNSKHTPVMIHRVIFGAFERFIAILTEHYVGKFPLWLSPVQVKVLTVNDRNIDFAREIVSKLSSEGLRVEIDDASETISKKVRNAQLERVNYILTIGDKEVEAKTLAVRTRDGKIEFGVSVSDFISRLTKEVEEKR